MGSVVSWCKRNARTDVYPWKECVQCELDKVVAVRQLRHIIWQYVTDELDKYFIQHQLELSKSDWYDQTNMVCRRTAINRIDLYYQCQLTSFPEDTIGGSYHALVAAARTMYGDTIILTNSYSHTTYKDSKAMRECSLVTTMSDGRWVFDSLVFGTGSPYIHPRHPGCIIHTHDGKSNTIMNECLKDPRVMNIVVSRFTRLNPAPV